MTIDDLAKEVGIGKGSVYLHFESKEELVLSHIDRIIDRLKTRLHTIASGKGSCEKRLRAMLIERVLYRFDSVQHYTQSLNEMLAHLRPKLLQRRERYFEEEAGLFAGLLSEGAESGVFNVKKPQQTAMALLDATNAFLPYSLSTHELGDRAEIERKVIRVADLLLNGLVKK
jgi:AcrR family transcriptional regulator